MPSYLMYIFDVAVASLVTLNALLLLTIFSRRFKLWPTPAERSWQHYTFWPLFRGGLGLTLLFSILTVGWPEGGPDTWRFLAGMICVVIGFGFTIYGYFDLGIENTYGADEGLVTGGLYRFSRNPQYVASILGFFGTGLANGSAQSAVLCGLAILVYVVLPYTEEPWLERAYGDVYADYKQRTPRFLFL
ncbi:CzcN domain-containing protein [Rhodomicrobium vannielii ATCC 17100]|jgi:protein-S-isoprenylcysteine O-methyltransferase Ste14|uniref:CzcN domain-containing protein n=1 Tax=Rhodomicrobium vannielii (strain ATCC 17100 / DSM 162 / LMG 4299 / NCIMB 10020 / ATH 3.1.1) TaxID=648757 RepID=E3I110_RHOVT|nr:PEMT/PEM2 methyltransferase family protein [Rhodomicrobium vannielii]ADP72333.1 CzcN domain-containing protein [Rhodomicrobium vannielii ATCC 17100]